MKIPPPNYTQIPNDLFDHWLPHLGEIEVKVLLVIMRKTFGWHKIRDRISISQLEKLTGSIPSNILKAIKNLISYGLIKKEVVGNVGTQETYYELVIHEDSNNLYPCRNESPPPVESTGTKEILAKEKKEQQHTAAVSSQSSEKKQSSNEIYPILKDIDIPLSDKVEISRRYSAEIVEHAIKWARHPSTKINSSLAAAIKWACKHQPSLPVEKENLEAANKSYAMRYDTKRMGNTVITALNNSVEFYWGGEKGIRLIKYDEPGFMEQFKKELKRHDFEIY